MKRLTKLGIAVENSISQIHQFSTSAGWFSSFSNLCRQRLVTSSFARAQLPDDLERLDRYDGNHS